MPSITLTKGNESITEENVECLVGWDENLPDLSQWKISSWEGFGKLDLPRYARGWDEIIELAELYGEFDSMPEAVTHYLIEGYSVHDTERKMQDAFRGTYESFEEHAREWVETEVDKQSHAVDSLRGVDKQVKAVLRLSWLDSDHIVRAIAVELAQDWDTSGDFDVIEADNGDVHIFWSH